MSSLAEMLRAPPTRAPIFRPVSARARLGYLHMVDEPSSEERDVAPRLGERYAVTTMRKA
jgi:hypothetical protein